MLFQKLQCDREIVDVPLYVMVILQMQLSHAPHAKSSL
jgi:hypothetical protein